MREGSRQAPALARRFRAENQELITLVAGLTDREWAMDCLGEDRSVGVVVQHIAEGHLIIGAIVRAIAVGRPLPVQARRTIERGAAFNAKQARRLAGGTQEDGLRKLRRNTERMARFIERLSDEELRRTALGVDGLILADEITGGLIGHLRGHARAIESAVMNTRASSPTSDPSGRTPDSGPSPA